MRDEEIRRMLCAERRRYHGVMAGLLGCAFATVGIFTIAVLFVPLAILCSIIGFARAAGVLSISGIAVSLLGCILSVVGVASSPILMLVVAGLFIANHPLSPASSPEAPSSQVMEPPPYSPVALSVSIDAKSELLPHTGPRSWCRKASTVQNILKALSAADGVRGNNIVATDFEDAMTMIINPIKKSFSCHGVAHFSNGQGLPGTFSVSVDDTGQSKWWWINDETPATASPLVSCGSAGCSPMDDSEAAREMADRANDENRRNAFSILNQSKMMKASR